MIDPANKVDGTLDLYIADGRVVGVKTAPDGFQTDREIDARGLVVCPGFVDLCARLREPGAEHKGTIKSETRAAVAGGITTVCAPPDTDPVIDDPSVVELIRRRQRLAGQAKVVMLGALTRQLGGEFLSEMGALMEAGCVGVTNAWVPIANPLIMRRALEYAATFDLTVFLYANDHWLANNGCVHEGRVAARLGLPGIPEAAETAAVARDLALIEQTGVRAHFCRLTTARAAQMVARAQFDGVPVTADVAIPYLYLSEVDVSDFDSHAHLIPPLRTTEDRQRLRDALRRGTFAALCSDHQPHEPDAKQGPFPSTEAGISGLDTLLPLGLRLVEEKAIGLIELLHRLTAGPAAILGLPCGTLAIEASADICIFDPDLTWQLDAGSMRSRCHNTPFTGWELKGRVKHTLLAGKPVYSLDGFADDR